jgi:hypothetical protein
MVEEKGCTCTASLAQLLEATDEGGREVATGEG